MSIDNKKRFIEIIKTLIYKENPSLLEKLNLNNENTFLEPLLFAYFNGKKENLFLSEMLEEIMQGYFVKKTEDKIRYSYNKNGIAYIPNQGYYIKGKKGHTEEIATIKNTRIELIKHPVKVLNTIFRDFHDNPIPETEIRIDPSLVKQYIHPLTNALQFIKKSSPDHFRLIKQCCKKVVLFKTVPENTNSFATINAHGIAFLNVYQEDYDEVFFVDDIAHQTGHIILTTLFFDRKRIFKIDENENIAKIVGSDSEYRSFYILFHALYTYFTTIICLENSITQNLFNEKQTLEAKARIGFYQKKYFLDIEKFEKFCLHYNGIENVLKNEGITLYISIKNKFFETRKKWSITINTFNYNNQSYNFTFKKFLEINQEQNQLG